MRLGRALIASPFRRAIPLPFRRAIRRAIIGPAAIAALVALVTVGCGDRNPAAPGSVPLARLTPPFGRTYTGLRDAARLVLRDEASFAAVWGAAYQNPGGTPPLPHVDFERDIVIAVALGEQGSGGYTIEVSRVTRRGGLLVVDVESALPGSACAVSLALTQPIDIVKVPAVGGLVSFEDHAHRDDCR
jgi:hypothetical protein